MNWRETAAIHAAGDYPRESCGLVVEIKGTEVYWPCRNMAASDGHFSIDPQDFAIAEDTGRVVGIVHSHPDQIAPRPSPADVAGCDAGDIPWHVISWPAGRWVEIQPRHRIIPLRMRPFEHGKTDCYSMIRDWYRLERGIVLPDYPRADGWWDQGQNLYVEQFSDAGFVEVDGPPQHGDVLLMQILSPVPNHAAVYLRGDNITHHLAGRLSCTEPWSGVFRGKTKKVLTYVA